MFTDNFNRTDENLEADANWTRVDGAAGKATVSTNKLSHVSGDESAFQCPDQASADHYTQIVRQAGSGSSSFEIAVRLTDHDNFAGALRNASSNYQLYKRVGSTFTLLGQYSLVPAIGHVERVEASGNSIEVFIDTVSRVGPITVTDHSTETRQGMVARATGTELWDDFEAGVLGGATIRRNPLTGPFDRPFAGPFG